MSLTSTSIAGKKILVTAYDLEQSEHRGIAVYTKALIHCLKQAGAEIWLLTEFGEPLKSPGLKSLPDTTQEIIRNARVLDSLARGQSNKLPNTLQRKLRLSSLSIYLKNTLTLIVELLKRPRHYRNKSFYQFRLNQLVDSPYPRLERLSYLKDVEGIVCAFRLFLSSQVAAGLRHQKPVHIDLRGFDALITSCPLNIAANHLPIFVQTVHDLIPLEYIAHNENPLIFSHRLQACLPARRLFVSQSTAKKFNQHIHKLKQKKSHKSQQSVIIQPPSLHFPEWITADPDRICDLRPVSHLLSNDNPYSNTSNQLSNVLRPFRYFLFNSSIEPRKNLLFLAQAYSESNLSSQGIQLCVTGKLKRDDYSKAVESIVKHEPGILLTNYVDESTKRDLYLNALGLVSPSLVEGFGIPVLDSACLGMPTIASDCESHLEIQAMKDFKDSVLTVNTLKSNDWAAAMESIAGINNDLWQNSPKERKRRISRYEKLKNQFYDKLQSDLEQILN